MASSPMRTDQSWLAFNYTLQKVLAFTCMLKGKNGNQIKIDLSKRCFFVDTLKKRDFFVQVVAVKSAFPVHVACSRSNKVFPLLNLHIPVELNLCLNRLTFFFSPPIQFRSTRR